MHSRTLTTVLTATALMLAGCTSEPETTLEPGQKAFVFESGVVPIGDFDPSSITKEDLFDPCNEISDEEFARAGFTGKKLSSTKGEIESPHGTSVCTFKLGARESINVMAVLGNRAFSEQVRTLRHDITSAILPEMYFYQMDDRLVGGDPCIAQIDTVQGAIAVAFTTINKNYSRDEMCIASKDLLEALYNPTK